MAYHNKRHESTRQSEAPEFSGTLDEPFARRLFRLENLFQTLKDRWEAEATGVPVDWERAQRATGIESPAPIPGADPIQYGLELAAHQTQELMGQLERQPLPEDVYRQLDHTLVHVRELVETLHTLLQSMEFGPPFPDNGRNPRGELAFLLGKSTVSDQFQLMLAGLISAGSALTSAIDTWQHLRR